MAYSERFSVIKDELEWLYMEPSAEKQIFRLWMKEGSEIRDGFWIAPWSQRRCIQSFSMAHSMA